MIGSGHWLAACYALPVDAAPAAETLSDNRRPDSALARTGRMHQNTKDILRPSSHCSARRLLLQRAALLLLNAARCMAQRRPRDLPRPTLIPPPAGDHLLLNRSPAFFCAAATAGVDPSVVREIVRWAGLAAGPTG